MNKQGAVWKGVVYPALAILIFVIVFYGTYKGVLGAGNVETFQKRNDAANIALLVDSIQAVPKEMATFVSYHTLTPGFSVSVAPHSVTVYKKTLGDGEDFMYTINPEFTIIPASLVAANEEDEFSVSVIREGNVIRFDRSENVRWRDAVFCPQPVLLEGSVQVRPSSAGAYLVNSAPSSISFADVPSSETDLFLGFVESEGIRVYVKDSDVSKGVGCQIMKYFVDMSPRSSVALLPVDTGALRFDDERNIVDWCKNSVVVGYDPAEYPDYVVADGVLEALRAYGLA